ncbi:nitrate/nitrite transport system substrate-binding protein [Novimethylophilus kurashikiensis]|uniref:Nitrate/nitrite transport system substrate-binding protein n=2 Tax=Novimethylophilus kurashikiensis TaxID=1825523 RepID=A0A2R5FCN1_9PROT|nr:CmpA/NrtA family ABC transporter substrate-binding protein [Novimethylophilus kurashikiensis]GBG15967.1 nitrate/nitrite transport system substrate-binding protein [Novimethylophilus kurashikiensis]
MSVKAETAAESGPHNPQRRNFIRMSVAAMGASAMMGLVPEEVRTSAWAAGKDTPEKTEVKIGFIPLTDCAPIVVAAEMGFDKKYGIKIVPSKEASWAGVRDKVVNGELDAAHVLYGLVYGVQQGIGGPQKDMAVLMTLNHNGQGITLSNQVREKGVTDGNSLKRLIDNENRDYTFAQTFPTGTHAMWLYYWLATYGINPMKDVKTIVVPPPQMVANMRVGNMDGFCVGEPWNARAIFDKIGYTVATSQDIWAGHPEKVLGTTAEFVQKHPNTARAMIMAVLDACRYIDATANRASVAKLISSKSYVNAPEEVIAGRFVGSYDNGNGKKWQDPNYMKFFEDGKVTFPYLSDGMWFLTQHKRWGMLKTDPDYLAVAKKVNQIDLYTEAAGQLKIAVPKDAMRSSKFIDGTVWDGKDPKAYAAGFKIKA